MATVSLSTLRSRLRIYLNDVNSKTWSADGHLDLFINHAVRKFTHDLPVSAYKLYTIATDAQGDNHTYLMPTDLVKERFVRGYFEGEAQLENVFRLNMEFGSWDENDEPRGFLLDWPGEEYLYLPREPQGSTFTLYYGKYHETWLTADVDTFDMGRNVWGEMAVLAYAAFLAFNPSSALRAQLEQWSRRGDQNVGNPLQEEADRWLALYKSLLADHAEVPESYDFVKATER